MPAAQKMHAVDSPSTQYGPLAPEASINKFISMLENGSPWYPALLHIISRWTAPDEILNGKLKVYLIDGEAFDWLALAERLIISAEHLIPRDEAERLVLFGIAPALSRTGEDEIAFETAIGASKYRAFLNYQYGVIVEQLVLAAAEEKLLKNASLFAPLQRPYADERAFKEVYGAPFQKLRSQYRGATDRLLPEQASRSQYEHFLYWLSKYRIRHLEPARTASDTRRAMLLLSRLEQHRNRFLSQDSNSLTAGSVYLHAISSNPNLLSNIGEGVAQR